MTNDRDNLQRRSADLRRLHKLIEQRKFKRALPFVRELVAKYPDESIVHVGLALCLSQGGQHSEALEILQTADHRFPNNYTILYHIAETQNEIENFEDAEKTYRKSLDLTPAAHKVERSECYNGIGVVLWRQHKRDEALEMWKLALKDNPENRAARKNLNQLTNEYGEPSAVSKEMDDLFHFMNIHQKIYLKEQGKTKFSTKQETEAFFSAVKEAWNTQLAHRGKEIDAMSADEKTELFKSVKMDYQSISKDASKPYSKRVPGKSRKPLPTGTEERKFFAMMNERFDFLPPDSCSMVMMVGTHALIAAGMEPERCIELMKGEAKATEEEKNIMLWTHDILKTLTLAEARKDTPEETGLMLRAISIAQELLTEEEAVDIVHEIRAEIQKALGKGA